MIFWISAERRREKRKFDPDFKKMEDERGKKWRETSTLHKINKEVEILRKKAIKGKIPYKSALQFRKELEEK